MIIMQSLFNNAECGPDNGLAAFSKELNGDRSLHQLANEFLRESGGPSERLQQQSGGFRGEQFNMTGLSKELEGMHVGPMGSRPRAEDWAADFTRHAGATAVGAPMGNEFAEMDAIYRRETAAQPLHVADWSREFVQTYVEHNNVPVLDSDLERAFEDAQEQVRWAEDFKKQQPLGWADEFTASEGDKWAEEFSKQESVDIDGDSKEKLSKTAGLLLDIVEGSSNPKFKQSKFLGFMKQLRDQRVLIEDGRVVDAGATVEHAVSSVGAAAEWAKEFGGSVNAQSWEEDFMAGSGNQHAASSDWSQEFQRDGGLHPGAGDWAQEFQKDKHVGWEDEFASQRADEAMEQAFREYSGPLTEVEPKDADWEADWANRAADPQQERVYDFTEDNPYLSEPYASLENKASHGNIVESILALEAIVQSDPQNAGAWHRLGLKQQENENDIQAIAALRRAVAADTKLLDGWIALAVSCTNEAEMDEAYGALEAWLRNSERYQHIVSDADQAPSRVDRHAFLSGLFMQAARQNVGQDLDADVQMALGVLFNISREYDKAVDCFEASLSKHPQDYMLWNKLGATLANSQNHERALDAYFNALQLNPAYIRARYNLAVSCIQLGTYREAAEHLLAALSIQEDHVDGVMPGNGNGKRRASLTGASTLFSQTLWWTLRNVVDMHMQRSDLANAVEQRDIQLKTLLKVIDNSGAIVVGLISLAALSHLSLCLECINVMGGMKTASLGDEIVCVVKKARPMSNETTQAVGKLKKGDVARALVVRTRKEVRRLDGTYIKFDDNAAVLINKGGQPLGNRVMGVIANECRQKRWAKIASLAPKMA
ncbi:Peroxisomal membrane signal receptor PTS1 [Irineochytrium annulatum]|nr:Peroxisomal membrane signal receptor PTS1 [Irineochytrium annulatum]